MLHYKSQASILKSSISGEFDIRPAKHEDEQVEFDCLYSITTEIEPKIQLLNKFIKLIKSNESHAINNSSHYFRGEQKRLEQTRRRGRRLSIIGFWQQQTRGYYKHLYKLPTLDGFLFQQPVHCQVQQSRKQEPLRVIGESPSPPCAPL